MQLVFRRLGDDEMERPPTQRDQFDNDDVELVDALVRESLQNSLDARAPGDTVRVRFSLHEPDESKRQELLRFLDLEKLKAHLAACSMMPAPDIFTRLNLLVIEDFGTTGLTGNWETLDNEPFSDFWRRMGKSHKAGHSLGRWGLGKLVFSSSSRIRVFFGFTLRKGKPKDGLLMGQAVLTTHDLDHRRLDSHGFFCANKTGIQLPVTDTTEIDQFRDASGLSRTDEPGLSIVIPYVLDSLTEPGILQAILRNYFFPILLGRLVVTVGSTTIDSDSFASLAKKYGGPRFSTGELAGFVGEMRRVRRGEIEPRDLPLTWSNTGLATALGDQDQVQLLRNRYQNGECLCVRVPLLLKRKDGKEQPTRFDLFLQKSSADSDSLFVRDTIVLPAESKYFRGHHVLAALVADDQSICEFLGDAENPAHTSWSGRAERVTEKWRGTSARLKEVRNALQQFHDAVVSSLSIDDPNALIDFFWAKSESGTRGARHKGPFVRPHDPHPPEPKEKAYRLSRRSGGFAIHGNNRLPPEQLPMTLRIRAAYDLLRGNPFARYDPLDFNFMQNEIGVAAKNANVTPRSPNVLIVRIESPDFEVIVDGFDVRRDLIIDVVRD